MLTLFFIIDILTTAFFNQPATLLVLGCYSRIITSPQKTTATLYALLLLGLMIPLTQNEPFRYCASILISLLTTFFIRKSVYITPFINLYITGATLIFYLFLIENQNICSQNAFMGIFLRIMSGYLGAWLCSKKENMLY